MKGMRLYFIGTALLLIVYLLVQYYRPRPTDWTPSFLREDKIPFGLYILKQELPSIFPDARIIVSRDPVRNTLKDRQYKHAAYFFICNQANINEMDYEQLRAFISRGNSAFIACFDFGKLLKDRLGIRTEKIPAASGLAGSSGALISFTDSTLRDGRAFQFSRELGTRYFRLHDTAAVLGVGAGGRANFLKYKIGQGALYLLPDPRLLSNYAFVQPRGAEYAEKLLSHVPRVETLIWDENLTRGNVDDGAVLRVIFRHAPLRWAYWLAVSGILLFVLFEMKRRQRIIPVLDGLQNSSVDFLTTVGRVYYEAGDNRNIALKKIGYLLEFIRSQYGLKTDLADEAFAKELAGKCGLPQTEVTQLINLVKHIQKGDKVSDAELIRLNLNIEKFYKDI